MHSNERAKRSSNRPKWWMYLSKYDTGLQYKFRLWSLERSFHQLQSAYASLAWICTYSIYSFFTLSMRQMQLTTPYIAYNAWCIISHVSRCSSICSSDGTIKTRVTLFAIWQQRCRFYDMLDCASIIIMLPRRQHIHIAR